MPSKTQARLNVFFSLYFCFPSRRDDKISSKAEEIKFQDKISDDFQRYRQHPRFRKKFSLEAGRQFFIGGEGTVAQISIASYFLAQVESQLKY